MIGYSDQHEHPRDAHRAHEHARLALRVAAALPEHGSPASWEELGAYRLLARAAETPHARELIHPGLPKLFALHSKESLVQTLEAYLDNGCDTKLTAEALFLHRASLYYRLQRIEAITETSLKSGADRLALHSGLKLARLVGIHPARRRHPHRLASVATLVYAPASRFRHLTRRAAGRPSNKFGRGGGRTRAHWRGAEDMRAHRMAVFGCTALLAIGAAACGGSDDDSDAGGGGATPADGRRTPTP